MDDQTREQLANIRRALGHKTVDETTATYSTSVRRAETADRPE